MTYISPFDHLKAIHWSKKTWMLEENAKYVGVEPDDGDQQNIGLTMSSFTSGLAVVGKRVFTLFFGGTPQHIIEHDIEAGTQGTFSNAIGFNDADDVACSGPHLYCSGADTGDGSTTYRVSKFDLSDNTLLWTKNLGAYTGGAIGIAANPTGFMISSGSAVPGKAKFYDPDGVLLGEDNTLGDIISYEWSMCATRDRFFIGQKTNTTATGQPQLRCYDLNGSIQYTVNAPSTIPLGTRFFPSVNERYAFFWVAYTATITNAHVIVCPRTVVRDITGTITSDVIDTSVSTVYDLGFTTFNIRKATVDATTFSNY